MKANSTKFETTMMSSRFGNLVFLAMLFTLHSSLSTPKARLSLTRVG